MHETQALRRTPLHAAHIAAGAKLLPFAGWEMPIQYAGIREEHLAVRNGAGVFDVSHMGQVRTTGPDALQRMQRLVSSDVRRIPEGGAQYSLLCNEGGGVLDDLFIYRLGEACFLTVTNAANHERDLEWMRTHASEFDADIEDRLTDFAMLAVQGPDARMLVQGLADGSLPPRMHCCERMVAGASVLVCGTGYTGEDGVELLVDPDHAVQLWSSLLGAGAQPIGLGARDTLRLEACFHLYGNDLDEDHDPISAGLGWACAEATGFIGAEAIAGSSGKRARTEAGSVRDRRAWHRAPGQRRPSGGGHGSDDRRGRHQRQLLAESGARHRNGVRFSRPGCAWKPNRDRCSRQHPRGGGRDQAPVSEGDPVDV